MSEIREKIERYLASKEKLNRAAQRVYKKNTNIYIAAERYKVRYTLLQRKVDIIKRLSNDFKLGCAINRAVQNVLNEKETVTEAAKHYKLDPEILNGEINQHKKLGKQVYIYDKLIDVNTNIFTFDEELLLMKQLLIMSQEKKKENSLSCICQICAMELLLNLAYKFAKKTNKNYPEVWNMYERADEEWLIDFEMIHGIKLSTMFPYNKCKQIESLNF